jgi:hypothetical protein
VVVAAVGGQERVAQQERQLEALQSELFPALRPFEADWKATALHLAIGTRTALCLTASDWSLRLFIADVFVAVL